MATKEVPQWSLGPTMSFPFLGKIVRFIYIFERQSSKDRKREAHIQREREAEFPIHWFMLANGHIGLSWTRWKSGAWNSVQVSHADVRAPSSWSVISCSPLRINWKLDLKKRIQGSYRHPNRMPAFKKVA